MVILFVAHATQALADAKANRAGVLARDFPDFTTGLSTLKTFFRDVAQLIEDQRRFFGPVRVHARVAKPILAGSIDCAQLALVDGGLALLGSLQPIHASGISCEANIFLVLSDLGLALVALVPSEGLAGAQLVVVNPVASERSPRRRSFSVSLGSVRLSYRCNCITCLCIGYYVVIFPHLLDANLSLHTWSGSACSRLLRRRLSLQGGRIATHVILLLFFHENLLCLLDFCLKY